MLYQRQSTQLMLMGFLFVLIGAAPFAWILGYIGTVPAGWTVQASKQIGQIAGAIGGVGGMIFLFGLMRRVFKNKVDYAERKLINFVLRFGIVFLIFAAGAGALTYLFKTMARGMIPIIESQGYVAAGGLAALGLVLFITGLSIKKPPVPLDLQ